MMCMEIFLALNYHLINKNKSVQTFLNTLRLQTKYRNSQ